VYSIGTKVIAIGEMKRNLIDREQWRSGNVTRAQNQKKLSQELRGSVPTTYLPSIASTPSRWVKHLDELTGKWKPATRQNTSARKCCTSMGRRSSSCSFGPTQRAISSWRTWSWIAGCSLVHGAALRFAMHCTCCCCRASGVCRV